MGGYTKQELVVQLNNALEFEHHIVGVKLLRTEEDYERSKAKPIPGRMPYCVMVKSACSGHGIKARKENFGCPDGAITMGVYDPMLDGFEDKEPGYFVSGKRYAEPGVYKDLETAQKTMENIIILEDKNYGVSVMPLEQYGESDDPDVVLIVADTYVAMRLIQGYTYEYGTFSGFRIAGNQAICSECTAYPFVNRNINMSLLCSGTRLNSKWGDGEVAIGMPFDMFGSVVNGVYQTINPLVRDEAKRTIEQKMKETGQEIVEIVYGENYDSTIYSFGIDQR